MNSPMEVDGNTFVTEDADDVPLDLSVKKEDGTETERKPVPKTAIVAASHRGPDGKSDLTRGGEPAPRHLQQPFVTVKQSNVQRASVVVRSPKAGSQAPKAYHAPAVSPLIADHVSSLDNFAASPDAAAYHSLMFSPGYNPYMAAAAAAVAAAASAKLPQPSLPLPSATLPLPSATLPLPSATLPLPSATLPLPSATLPLPSANLPLPSATLPLSATSRASAATQFHHHQFNQQQMQFQQQQQFQIQQQQQQQLQIQQQQQMQMHLQQQLQQQQQQLATYGGNAFDVNSMMMAQKMTSPLYVATSSPSSSSESGAAFPYGNFSMDCLPRSAYGFGYPYFGGLFGGRGTGGGVRFRGGSGGGALSDGRSDCMSPESITMADAMPYRRTSRRYSTDDNNNNNYSSDGSDGVDPEEVAAIYRQSDFLSFRQRYIDSLGPPKNFEKMRRSVPGNRKKMMNGQMQQHDQTYVIKRQKNNEAAKKSRDAKRQKFIENQISVMYLTKKVSEMKEIKRRLLLTM